MRSLLLVFTFFMMMPTVTWGALSPVPMERWGRTETFMVNTSYVSLVGTADTDTLRKVAAAMGLRITDVFYVQGVTVLQMDGAGNGPTTGEIERFLRRCAAVPGIEWTGPVFFDGPDTALLTGNILVRFPKGTSGSVIEQRLARAGLSLKRVIHGAHEIALAASRGYVLDVYAGAVRSGLEAFPEMMRRLYPKLVPTDEYFQYEWYLNNTGNNVQNVYSGLPMEGIPMADVRAEDAWDISTGDPSTVIAVIDSGVDCNHPELATKCIAQYNAITDANDAAPPDPATDITGGHGTSVAGVAAAPIDDQGVVGACPDCSIVAVRLIDSGTFLTDTMILNGYKFAVDNGATIINNSWGPAGNGSYFIPVSSGELEGMDYALAGRGGKGVVVVYAAGNENIDIRWYGHLMTDKPNVIAVAASNHRDHRSTYSNYGDRIAVSAPSSDQYMNPTVYTLERVGGGDVADGYTKYFGGTSSAAPVVSGTLGLVASLAPDLDASSLIEIIEQTADKVDPDGGFYDSEGHSPAYGFGRVNAWRALLRAQGADDRPWCTSPAASEDCSVHRDDDCDGYVDEGCTDASPLGIPCTDASQCGSEAYWECPDTGKVRGICTWDCSQRPCPNGYECADGVCSPVCTFDDGGCPSSEFICSDYTFGHCLPKCLTDSDCVDGEKCDLSSHKCVLDTDGQPGSPCSDNDDCIGNGGVMCLSENMGFPGGYCIHSCGSDMDCGGIAKCLHTAYGSYCYRSCSLDGDCRPEYVCEQAGPRAGTCYKKCSNDDQCTGWDDSLEGVVGCEVETGRCVWLDSTDTGDGTDATDTGDGTDSTDTGDGTDSTDTGSATDDGTSGNSDDGGCSCSVPARRRRIPLINLLLVGMFLAFVRRWGKN